MSKIDIASEIAEAMEGALSNSDEIPNKIASALEHLNLAAEIFDSLELHKEAEHATALLEVIAKKKSKKSKSKSKKPAKKSRKSKSDSATEGLDSEKMLDNLAHKGWVFNADDYDGLEVDDSNYDFDTSEDAGYHIERDDDNYADPYEKTKRERELAKIMQELEKEEEAHSAGNYGDFAEEFDQFGDERSRFPRRYRSDQHFMLPPAYDEIEMPPVSSFRPKTKNWRAIEEIAIPTVRPPRRR